MALSLKDRLAALAGGAGKEDQSGAEEKPARPQPGIADKLAGEAKSFVGNLKPHLPLELIGGSIPHIPGTEEEAVWNAAAQACGTERVYFCYSVEGDRCWYLATPASSMASNPDSWCPLAAALPGNSEFWDKQTVYLYEQDGVVSALRWDQETGRMQVFIGASRTLLPRIQSMDANFVTVNPDGARIVPWHNRAMHTEKLSRATARMLLLSGMLVCFCATLFLMYQYAMTAFMRRDLAKVHLATEKASNDLMINAYNALQSDTIKHMVKIQQLLDALGTIDGTLVKYKVDKGKTTWEALVPKSFSEGIGPVKGQVQQGIEKDGRVRIVGN